MLFNTIMKNGGFALTEEQQWTLVKSFKPIGSAESWKELLEHLLNHGHQVAFISFSLFGNEIGPRYLREVVGLETDLIKKIYVDSWLTANLSTASKNQHIENAKNYFQTHETDQIVLIDDTLKNIEAFNAIGTGKRYHAIYVPSGDVSHIDKMYDYTNRSFNNIYTPSVENRQQLDSSHPLLFYWKS